MAVQVLIGKKFQHKHIKTMTCTVMDQTPRGNKVIQVDTAYKKGKPVQKNYEHIYFHPEKGVWTLIN